jgi:hypothetical protein
MEKLLETFKLAVHTPEAWQDAVRKEFSYGDCDIFNTTPSLVQASSTAFQQFKMSDNDT